MRMYGDQVRIVRHGCGEWGKSKQANRDDAAPNKLQVCEIEKLRHNPTSYPNRSYVNRDSLSRNNLSLSETPIAPNQLPLPK